MKELKDDHTETQDQGSLLFVVSVSFVAAIGGLLFGFDIGVISGAIPFITKQFHLNAVQEGFTVSNLQIGCIVGAIIGGMLSDRYGRKKILLASAVFFALSAIFSAIPRNLTELIIARFMGGIAVGVASVLSPMYIAEIAPAGIRGRLVSLNQLTIVTGILLSYLTNWLLVDIGINNWRWMLGIESMPAILFFIALIFVPESPRWLTKQGKVKDALKILTRAGGSKQAKTEIDEINKALTKEEGKITELLKPGLRLILLVAVFLAIFQQFTGINTVIFYAPKIFLRAGYESTSSALFASIIVGLINLICTFIAIGTIDKFGRKPLLLIGLAGMTISFTLTGLALKSQTIGGIWVLIPILTYVGFFAMSLGPVVWVIIAEIFPTKIRGSAVSIVTMVLWLSCFVVSQTFPWLIDKIGEGTFYMYAGICVIAFIFVWTMVSETKGKTLEEIESLWIK